nr:sulfotransferase [Desulfobulbaceae bacterium]
MITLKRINNLRFRMSRQLHIQACDIHRNWLWHTGGKEYYTRHYQDILEAHKWVFIVGCNNSGTTLLQKALEKCGQISVMKFEGQRHTNTLPRAYKYGFDRVWSEYAEDLHMPINNSAAILPRLVHDWISALPKPVNQVIVEKTPANLVRMDFLNKHFPHAYFIGLVRNGYAVAEGIKRRSGHSLERAAKHWKRVGELLTRNSQEVANYLEVRYEDLAENPTANIAKLAEFIGLETGAPSDVKAEAFALPTERGCIKQSIQNLNSESISRLTVAEKKSIYKHAGAMLDLYDYSTNPALQKKQSPL